MDEYMTPLEKTYRLWLDILGAGRLFHVSRCKHNPAHYLACQQSQSNPGALQHARDMTQALTAFRNTYSSEVVGRLDPAAGTIVSHDYRSTEHAIPLPATLSIELAEELSTLSEGSAFRMVSEYPFPWRTDRVLSDF